jgi:D-alanyl-D-alanine carboxypeptidase
VVGARFVVTSSVVVVAATGATTCSSRPMPDPGQPVAGAALTSPSIPSSRQVGTSLRSPECWKGASYARLATAFNEGPRTVGALRAFAIALTAAPVALSLSGRATPPAQQSTGESLVGAVDTIAEAALRDLRLPSLSIAIARGSRVLLAKAYGLADLENDVPASERTVYRIGSITKQFTAAAVLRLAEQRKLSLDDEISRYVPSLQRHGWHVSIRQLLNHTSGIRSFTAIPAFVSKERLDLSDNELLSIFENEAVDFEPGTNFLYNNSAYYLLALVIERLSGRAYRDYMRDEVFRPLGLADTMACDDHQLIPHRAHGYTVSSGILQNAPFISMAPPKGGGNLCSTAMDLVKWSHALADRRVVNRESYGLMTQPGTLHDGRRVAYGLGLFLSAFDGTTEVSHGGSIVGFTGFLGVYPADDLIVVTLTNSDTAHLYDGHLARRIVRGVLGRPRPELRDAPVDAALLDRFVGRYRLGSAVISVQREGARLTVSGDGAVEQLWERVFAYQGAGVFTSVENPEFRLAFTPVEPRSTRVSLTFSERAFGDATRVESPGG